MILTDEMLALAFKFREVELWNFLTDSDIFAFRLSDGETGYCCVMGNADEHYALGFYRGDNGFSSYLKTLQMANLDCKRGNLMDLALNMDYINCDFVQAAEIDGVAKKRIRNYADKNGLKINRKKGWPDFVRFNYEKVPYFITNERDAQDIKEALSAAIAVANKLMSSDIYELGFDEKEMYPTMKGGKEVPYLIPDSNGTYIWSMVKLPALKKNIYPSPKFKSDILVSSLKKLQVRGVLMVKFTYFPSPVNDVNSEVPFLPSMLMCLDAETEMMFPVMSSSCLNDNSEQILIDFANVLIKNGTLPSSMMVSDGCTAALLKDFCKRCGIRLHIVDSMPAMDEAVDFVMSNMW